MTGETLYGVTPPMTVELPTEDDLRMTETLLEELKRQKTYETQSETEKRHRVIKSLEAIADEFVKRVAREREPNNEVLIRNARGKVFPYGSFRLGVYGPGSDIDTLVVAPKYVSRDDYFKYFPELLVSMAPKGAITDMTVVTDAFVPIIKFEYHGISIDLIFSRIIQKQLPPDFNLKDSNHLRGLDEAELRSLNGTRVTDEILSLVPERGTFRNALRAIKLWAQRRAIYANIMGFPGGVAWAMLVARICQLYPKATPSVIVCKFFIVIGKWRWPHPVLLKPIESGPLPVRVWNPKIYKGDSFHLMPIITPAYPSMCATFNITRSSMTIINRELLRAMGISERIRLGKLQWSDLFVKHTFFTADYKHYVSVISASQDKESHKIWSGYVESKIRMLVQKLEQHPEFALAHAFNKGYERRHLCKNDNEIAEVQDGSLAYLAPKVEEQVSASEGIGVGLSDFKTDQQGQSKVEESVDGPATSAAQDNGNVAPVLAVTSPATAPQTTASQQPVEVFTTTHYIGLQFASDEKPKSLDLSELVKDFKDFCMQWQKYQDDLKDLVSLGVHYVRNINLPDDVFELGEVRPRKKSSAKGAPHNKKRGPADDGAPPAKKKQASVAAAG